MISQKSQYALRALLALARANPGEPLRISTIAAFEKIPKKFLEQILLDLKRAGLVASRRGQQGGYLLQKPASEIAVGAVLRVTESAVAPLACLSHARRCEDCEEDSMCAVRRVFARVAMASNEILDGTTLADILPGGGILERPA